MNYDKKFIQELKKQIKKDWGSKCPDYSALCCTCLIWRAYEAIESLYDTKYHLTNWKVEDLAD